MSLASVCCKSPGLGALARNCAWLRLEVRADNSAAIRLYEANGYQRFASVEDYYEDHAARRCATRNASCAKHLPPPGKCRITTQTTEFTCGAACLLMAMSAIDASRAMTRAEEIQLWREATTIFMTAGHGGCSLRVWHWRPGGAVSMCAWKSVTRARFFFTAYAARRRVDHETGRGWVCPELAATQVEQVLGDYLQIGAALAAGYKPLVLISSYRFTRLKAPHWVIITGCDEDFVYLHDPDVDHSKLKRGLDCQHLPVSHQEFLRMTVFACTAGSRSRDAALPLKSGG